MSDTVPFLGQEFALPEKFNQRLFLRFSRLAAAGKDTGDAGAMGVVDELLEQCVRPEDSARFDGLCDEHGASMEELMEFMAKVMAAVSERPTVRPSVLSDGPTTTPPKSGSSSDVAVTELFPGRPDLQVMALRNAREMDSTAV